jgi:hypothetical protein
LFHAFTHVYTLIQHIKLHKIKHIRFQLSVYIENPFDLREETDLTELNKTKTMANQQFKKVLK